MLVLLTLDKSMPLVQRISLTITCFLQIDSNTISSIRPYERCLLCINWIYLSRLSSHTKHDTKKSPKAESRKDPTPPQPPKDTAQSVFAYCFRLQYSTCHVLILALCTHTRANFDFIDEIKFPFFDKFRLPSSRIFRCHCLILLNPIRILLPPKRLRRHQHRLSRLQKIKFARKEAGGSGMGFWVFC